MISGSTVEAAPSTGETQFHAARIVVQNCLDIYNLQLSNIDKIGDDDFQLLMKQIASSVSIKQKRPWATNGHKNHNYKGNII